MHDFRAPGDRMTEDCGVFGLFDPQKALHVAEICYFALYALQHRGEESGGIAVSDGQTVRHIRAKGLISDIFDEETLAQLTGHIGIGHVRYSTFGGSDPINAQPLVARYRGGTLAMAHNGSLVNAHCLRTQLEEMGAIFQTSVDTEVILNLLARMKNMGIEQAVLRAMQPVRGSYALVLQTQDQLVGIRDPFGIRPLCLGRLGEAYLIASESCAFDAVGATFVRDVRPGEVIVIDQAGLRSFQMPTPLSSALCIFEFVYFARTDSVIDGVGVYAARKAAGKRLALGDDVKADMVIGAPDSALPAAIGYAEQSGIPYGEGLAKNRYVGRTFIQPEQGMREVAVRTKLNALARNVKGKRLVLIDDSIVRGTTSKKIVDMLRMAGAREVHMRISSPPVIHPCHFGIDTATSEELIGSTRTVNQICDYIGADSLKFLSREDLLRTVEDSGCGFCMGCFDGHYPMAVEGDTQDISLIFDSEEEGI